MTVALNKPIINIVGENAQDAESRKNYTLQIGMISSALEHVTPEQMFTDANNPGEAVSAVRAIQKATQQGQRIYQITGLNQASTLPNIHHDIETMDEIRNAVNTGKEVITHTDSISVPGWSGAGYIILDAETGSGAYKISGGANGGAHNVGIEASAALGSLATLNNIFAKLAGVATMLSPYMFAAIAMTGFVVAIMGLINGGVDFSAHKNSTNLIEAFTTIATIGAVLTLHPGVGALGAIIAIFMMLHLILAELVILFASILTNKREIYV